MSIFLLFVIFLAGAFTTSALLNPIPKALKIAQYHNSIILSRKEQQSTEESENTKFSWSSGNVQRRRTEIEQSNEANNESLDEFEKEAEEESDAYMNPFGEVLQLARSLYEGVFFYGLNDGDGTRMVDRSKLLKSDDFRKFKSKGLDSVILTEDELVALYLTKVKSKKPTVIQQPKSKGKFNPSDDTDDFNNNAYIVTLKKDLLLLKSNIRDIEQQLKITAISLAAAEEDNDDVNIKHLQTKQQQLKAQLQQRKVQLITIQADLMDLQ